MCSDREEKDTDAIFRVDDTNLKWRQLIAGKCRVIRAKAIWSRETAEHQSN